MKKVGLQKRLSLRKKVVDSRNRFEYVVRLVATQGLVAALVFENRIAVINVICEKCQKYIFENKLSNFHYKLESLILAQNERWRRA